MPKTPPPSSLLSLLLLALTSITRCSTATQHQYGSTEVPQVRAGFWSSHSNSYSPVANINASLFTHIYYSSLSLDISTMQVAPPHPDKLAVFANLSRMLKNQNAALKTLISISSIDRRVNMSQAFSSMAANYANRAAFIDSSIHLARENSYDGLDLSWQYPSSTTGMNNLASLLREWRARVNQEGNDTTGMPPLLLTASVYFSGHLFDAPSDNIDYPIQAISECLDWVNILSFGYHNDRVVTAADAALFDVTSHYSTSYGISSWLDAGLPSCKLVMGIPLYGRSWFLKNKVKYGFGAEVVANGPKQKLSNQTGIMAYFEIESFFSRPKAEFRYDDQTVSAYFHIRDLWVSFDSMKVIKEKLAYAKKNELLGYFLSPVSFDTPNNTIAQMATDLWNANLVSNTHDKNSTKQSHTPSDLPPLDQASSKSASTPGSGKGTSRVGILQAHCYILLLFHILHSTVSYKELVLEV